MKKELVWWIIIIIVLFIGRELSVRAGMIERYGLIGILFLVGITVLAFIGASRTIWRKDKKTI